jgi:hypothetical protein
MKIPSLVRKIRYWRVFQTLLLSFGCSGERVSEAPKPIAPDMSALTNSYEAPSGTLNAEAIRGAVDFVDRNLAEIATLGAEQQLLDALKQALQAENPSEMQSRGSIGTTRQALTLEGEGFLRITRVCNGHTSTPVADKENNGFFVFTVGFTDAGVDPVVWGNFFACSYLAGTTRVKLDRGLADDGDIRLFIGRNLAVERVGLEPVIVDLNVTATIDDATVDVRLDFRIDPENETFELRVPSMTGDLIAVASSEALVGIRAKNGNFVCDLGMRTCTAFDGESISY